MGVLGFEAHTLSGTRAVRFITRKGIRSNRSCRFFSSTFARSALMDQLLHTSGIDAEPLDLYRRGGYHPVCLGDVLNDGRYKVLHKLGWGGYSTVWAARDQREGRYVAIKISVSEREGKNRELVVMRTIRSGHPDSPHLMQMLDHFKCDGPNGSHDCLVLELLGPSVSDLLDARFRDERLPGKLAKSIAIQALLGLDRLHQQKIAHGDLHTRNLAFALPSVDSLDEAEFLQKLGKPEIGAVRRSDGKPLESGIPEYLVRPTSYPKDPSLSSHPIKIVDFGESFLDDDIPNTLHTPLPVRAPEVIFGDQLDYRVDLWSMGCMLFELFTGQPPFDSFMVTPTVLVRQMLEMASDGLPERWQQIWCAMNSASPGEDTGYALQGWLEEVYFDGERDEDLTREDVVKVGELVSKMLRFEPPSRASAAEIVRDPWFKGD